MEVIILYITEVLKTLAVFLQTEVTVQYYTLGITAIGGMALGMIVGGKKK